MVENPQLVTTGMEDLKEKPLDDRIPRDPGSRLRPRTPALDPDWRPRLETLALDSDPGPRRQTQPQTLCRETWRLMK